MPLRTVMLEDIGPHTRKSRRAVWVLAALATAACSSNPAPGNGTGETSGQGGAAAGGNTSGSLNTVSRTTGAGSGVSDTSGSNAETGNNTSSGAGNSGGESGSSRPADAEASGSSDSASGSSGATSVTDGGADSGSSDSSGSDPSGSGSTSGSSGSTTSSGAMLPCDVYESANTPCVGAYSTVRALYRAYSGSLYQVRRTSDKTTKDIPVLSPGGFADASVQDAFCTGDCTISIIYDQSPKGNHLPISPPVYWLKNGGTESDAKAAKINVGGHPVYGVKGVAGRGNTYRNNKTTGVATGDEAEALYMVADSKFYSSGCCYDFGNVETSGNADGKGAMETIYWGGDSGWGHGGGSGPWVMTDIELGVFGAATKNAASDTSLITPAFVTLVMKGPSGNNFALKGGDAQTGLLMTKWNGNRPSGWSPMKKEGAIVLGAGGDGSNGGSAIFYEGAITSGSPPDATDDALQASIVAAGYGH